MKPFLAWLVIILALPVWAHEVRPAYLQLRESVPGEFTVLWKTPMQGEMRLALTPVFSGANQTMTPVVTQRAEGAAMQSWHFRAIEPLRGQSLLIDGLEATLTDTIVRIEFADGSTWSERLTPARPSAEIPMRQSSWSVAVDYLSLGIEHILLGIDHLLFVFALLLIAKGWNLVKTITAFTLAHSITLALAALGVVAIPQAPVEAVIALSIVFAAAEVLRAQKGIPSLTSQAPWLMAFAFGLLHGFGFAGALSEIGLPQGQIVSALLFFNLGVEVGQLGFIAAVLGFTAVLGLLSLRLPTWAKLVPPYIIGSIAMFWVIQRAIAL